RVVDQHIESAELAEHLKSNRVDIVLVRDVAGDPMRAGMPGGDLGNPPAGARHECDAGTAPVELANQRQAESRRASGDADLERLQPVHDHLLSKELPLLSLRVHTAVDFVKSML